MHVGNQMVSGTTLQTNMAATRTVIVEVKYINSKNVVIHSENCKVEIPLDITAQRLSKKICRMTGIYEASKKRGFTDCSTEMFYVDYIEPGQLKKAPFVLRTDDQLSMFFKSESKSILLRLIQRIVQFEKGSVNIHSIFMNMPLFWVISRGSSEACLKMGCSILHSPGIVL